MAKRDLRSAGDAVFATTETMDTPHDICGFDANVESWTACFDIPNNPGIGVHFSELVGDPINNRLVVVNPMASAWASVSRIGAINLDTGGWTQLLAPASP